MKNTIIAGAALTALLVGGAAQANSTYQTLVDGRSLSEPAPVTQHVRTQAGTASPAAVQLPSTAAVLMDGLDYAEAFTRGLPDEAGVTDNPGESTATDGAAVSAFDRAVEGDSLSESV